MHNPDLIRARWERCLVAAWTRCEVATTRGLAEMTPTWVRTELMSRITHGHRETDPASAGRDSDLGMISKIAGGARPKVLLVVDDGEIAHMHELGLGLNGYPVRLASSG